jgi:DNA-binding transcriptional ArsR family regulator
MDVPSEDAARLLDGLKDSLRLRILLALEAQPRSPKDLSDALDVPYDKVNWALKTLEKAELVQIERHERAGPRRSAVSNVFAARHVGWARLLPVLDGVASTHKRAKPATRPRLR